MTPRVTMRKALADPALLGSVLKGDSWYGWRVLLIASAGEELTDDERVIFTKITGRGREPGVIIKELVAIFGRRAGKSLAMACFLVWIAGLCDHRGAQAPGETLIALVLSWDQRISKSLLNYVEGIVQNSPLLRSLIVNRTADTIELQHHVQITVRPCNAISPRGLTLICAVLDEISFWFTSTDYADPDVEILAALRPTLLTTKGPILMASSVYAKVGVLYDAYKQYYGAAGPSDILVGFGTSRDMNPLLSQAEIDRELERDPLRNRAEYLSEWRDDVEGFISREIVEACIGDYHELPPQDNISYSCFVDAASGVPDGDFMPPPSPTAVAIRSLLLPSVKYGRRFHRPALSLTSLFRYVAPFGCIKFGAMPSPVSLRANRSAWPASAMNWFGRTKANCTAIRCCRCSIPKSWCYRAIRAPSIRSAAWNAARSAVVGTKFRIPCMPTMILPTPSPAPRI